MRYIITIPIALFIFFSKTYSQEKSGILFTGSFVNLPEYRMKGGGYTVSFQREIHHSLFLELGAGYSLASHSNVRGDIVNGVRLLELNYHSAGYKFYLAPVVKVGKSKAVSLDIYAGPVINYQSNVMDQYHYEMPPGLQGRITDIVYGNSVKEGSFPGGIGGCRIKARMSGNWSLFGSLSGMWIPKGISSIDAGLGFQFHW